jgi:hypothetical protein
MIRGTHSAAVPRPVPNVYGFARTTSHKPTYTVSRLWTLFCNMQHARYTACSGQQGITAQNAIGMHAMIHAARHSIWLWRPHPLLCRRREEIREAFDLFDTEKTGRMDYHELKACSTQSTALVLEPVGVTGVPADGRAEWTIPRASAGMSKRARARMYTRARTHTHTHTCSSPYFSRASAGGSALQVLAGSGSHPFIRGRDRCAYAR